MKPVNRIANYFKKREDELTEADLVADDPRPGDLVVVGIAAAHYNLAVGDCYVFVRSRWRNAEGWYVVRDAAQRLQEFPDVFFTKVVRKQEN